MNRAKRREVRNELIRRYGCVELKYMTRWQLQVRLDHLRQRGRHPEALTLLKSWLVASKSMGAA